MSSRHDDLAAVAVVTLLGCVIAYTSRMMRVLDAIANHPDAQAASVMQHAGLFDEGGH